MRRTLRRAALGLIACALAAGSAGADVRGRFRWRHDAIDRYEAAAELHPRAPVAVHWHAVKLGSIDLGAPLVAIAAADLDGDGKGELYLVTSREVIAVGVVGRVHELGRVAFAGEPAVPQPRDVVGTAVVDGQALVAGVSAWARELRVTWSGGALVAHGASTSGGFLLCPGERAPLAPGRNYYEVGGASVYAVRCRDGARAALAITGKLGVDLASGAHTDVLNAGVAFDLADVDRDGTPEVIVTDANAPGDPDAIRVLDLSPRLGGAAKKPLFQKRFAGGVAGVVAVDGDGDGTAEIIAAVRLAGATRVDLWRLD